ncbi:MAG: multidrug-efflux system secretion protein HlyD family, partial [Phenylobacterium sp.]|nr:multidrug-efflux system secretion protein HlyD family [Phenylobacterium sp.]
EEMRHAVVMGAAVLLLAGCHKKAPPAPPPPTVIVSKPLAKSIVDWDDFVGRFEAVNSIDVRPRVTGYLQSIHFTDGQLVGKGQLLFVIDPRPYKAALDQAQGQLAHAEATLANARVELARAVKLLAAHAISEQEYQTRLAAERQAAADEMTARGNVETAALNLGFTRITSPVAGRASDRRFAVGNLVTQDSTVLTNVVDLDPIRFSFYGAESLYLKYERQSQAGVRPSSRRFPNPVDIRLQDQPDYAIRGRMDFVDNALDSNSGTIRGRALVSNPSHLLTPGMFGHLRLLGSGAYTALLLPDDAITTQQSDQIVYVVDRGGVAEQRKIQTGPTVDGLRVVRAGLSANDLVIIEGLQRARQGLKVRTQPGTIVPPAPGASPTPADLAPPPAAGTFADASRPAGPP